MANIHSNISFGIVNIGVIINPIYIDKKNNLDIMVFDLDPDEIY